MSDSLKLYSFGFNDRSGKIRWTAGELGILVEEHKVELGDHRKQDYRAINPYAAIPSALYKGETLIESTASCIHLAEMFPEKRLAVFAKEEGRYDYLKWIAICSETLEGKLVDYILANSGLMPEEIKGIYQKTLEFKCRVLVEQLPKEGFLAVNRFTIADIVVAYSLKIAIITGFVRWEDVQGYLQPLMDRQAARESRFFEGLIDFLETSRAEYKRSI
ncbi:MAG: glutathione S-transferase family protein [Kangiellaceae bacterium]|nr:glutathione S-transferase family protein [Kangiellaceae bacterium]MCW9000572.1 glutathione S-transferase family protein [Kangiellaceae bacterium]